MTEDDVISGRELRRRFRTMAAAQLVLVAALVFGFWLMQQVVERVDAEQQARAVQTCEATATGRATHLIFTEVLIAASTADGDTTESQRRQIAAFRDGVEERMLGVLPATCRDVMTLPEFRERVRVEARPPPEPGALPP